MGEDFEQGRQLGKRQGLADAQNALNNTAAIAWGAEIADRLLHPQIHNVRTATAGVLFACTIRPLFLWGITATIGFALVHADIGAVLDVVVIFLTSVATLHFCWGGSPMGVARLLAYDRAKAFSIPVAAAGSVALAVLAYHRGYIGTSPIAPVLCFAVIMIIAIPSLNLLFTRTLVGSMSRYLVHGTFLLGFVLQPFLQVAYSSGLPRGREWAVQILGSVVHLFH